MKFEKITNENFKKCIDLSPGEDNYKFVAPNDISLAQAYVAIANDTCIPLPFGIYDEDVIVGFIMMSYIRADQDEDLDEPIYEIWRFMIGEDYQDKGYGKKSLAMAIDYIKTKPCGEATKCYLSYVPGNEKAQGLYKAVGFEETGEFDGGEVIMSVEIGE